MDVRGTTQVWDTLANFHAGDALTVWGWSPGGIETIDALDGAAGYQGATLRLANAQGSLVSSVDPGRAVGGPGRAFADELGTARGACPTSTSATPAFERRILRAAVRPQNSAGSSAQRGSARSLSDSTASCSATGQGSASTGSFQITPRSESRS